MSNQANKLRSKSSHQHKKYQKFVNDVYSCLREKQSILKRCSTPDQQNFPRLLHQEKVGLSAVQQLTRQSKYGKSTSQMKSTKFKNFLNALDQHQKKVSIDNMNLLGLQVKKINYCEKAKRVQQKNIPEAYDQNFQTVDRENLGSSKTHLKKTVEFQPIQDFTCHKIGLSYREGFGKSRGSNIIMKGNFYKTRQKSRAMSQTQQKRRTLPEFQNPIYDNRINTYRELIYKLNIVHGIYVQTEKQLNQDFLFKNQMKYKAWVGSGNNGNLIKSLLKRRFWWNVVEDKTLNANFIWTQLKVNQFFAQQIPSSLWLKDVSKFWGKAPQIEQPLKFLKKFPRKKNSLQKQINDDTFLYKIFTEQQQMKYKQYGKKLANKSYRQRKDYLELPQLKNQDCKMHNHLINNFYLGNKKALFYNLKQFYELINQNPFTRIPLTFHIKKGVKDIQYKRFLAYYKRRQATIKKQQKQDNQRGEKKKMRNVWIVKPGQLTNRGHGITVIDEVYQLNSIIKRQGQHDNGAQKTFIVQLYIDRPLLYQKRKFDIRHYMLITHINGLMRAYWYKEGYIRTSSYQFDIQNFQRQIHLTNDAVQKYTPLYGRYEPGNKISYGQFQRYLDTTYPKKNYNFQQQILPQMKQICLDAVKSSYLKLSPQRLKHNFEFFGLDFMIDQSFKPWLIQINTNPCLQLSAPLLARIIPQAVDQALRLSLDIVFPPPCHYPNTSKHLAPEAALQNLNYQLIFDQKRDGSQLRALYKKSTDNLLDQIGNISEDQTYQDDGKCLNAQQIL